MATNAREASRRSGSGSWPWRWSWRSSPLGWLYFGPGKKTPETAETGTESEAAEPEPGTGVMEQPPVVDLPALGESDDLDARGRGPAFGASGSRGVAGHRRADQPFHSGRRQRCARGEPQTADGFHDPGTGVPGRPAGRAGPGLSDELRPVRRYGRRRGVARYRGGARSSTGRCRRCSRSPTATSVIRIAASSAR